MAKNKKKPTKDTVKMDKSDEVLTAVDNKKLKAEKNNKNNKANQKKLKDKKKKNEQPKRNKVKEVTSELKKVNWPTFKNACKQTGTVLVVVGVFMLAVLGIDSLVSWILRLITKI